jgi:GNAT superfamily N-acetyltransferase
MEVRPLAAGDGPACDAIMRTLPDWFGYEPGLEECAQAVRNQAGLVAVEAGEILGFATWEQRTPDAAEITWAAVRRDRRNGGIGTAIIEALAQELHDRGFALALAMTSARSKTPDPTWDSYHETRAFWRARRFYPLIELDIMVTDIALLQVRAL